MKNESAQTNETVSQSFRSRSSGVKIVRDTMNDIMNVMIMKQIYILSLREIYIRFYFHILSKIFLLVN